MAKCSHFLVITQGHLDHLFSYAAGNGRDQKSDLALQTSCPEGRKKVGGRVNLSPPFLSLSFVSFSIPSHTHTHTCTVEAHMESDTGTDREEKVDAVILSGGYRGADGTQQHCYIVLQSNDSERTRHISMQPPSTQHALLPRSSGTTL